MYRIVKANNQYYIEIAYETGLIFKQTKYIRNPWNSFDSIELAEEYLSRHSKVFQWVDKIL